MSAEEEKNIEIKATAPNRKSGSSFSLAAMLMMAGLLLSKLTGQLREILIVPMLGRGIISDAYIIGFQIPDLFYQLLVGGAIQAAITPTIAAAIERRQEKKSWRSVSIFINLTCVAVMLAVLLGELLAPVLIPLYNAGKEQATIDLAIKVSRALFPQVFFMMLAALCIGVLNANKKFSSTSFGPSFYNICVILAMILLGQSSSAGAIRMASGVMLSAGAYFVLQFWLARKDFRYYDFAFDYRDKGFRRLLSLAVPTLISGSIVQINMIILTGFANQDVGTVTSLRNASTAWQLPYGVFAIAIGNVMLPSLAALYARHDDAGSRRLYVRSLRSALFLVIPSAAIFLAMQQDVVRAIFQWGAKYTDAAVVETASILRWYCLAMVAQSVIFLTNQAFYARRMTKMALYNGIMTLLLNWLFCEILTRWTALGAGSLSLAYTLTSFISVIFLYSIYRRRYPAAAPKRIWPFLIKSALCASALILAVLALSALPVHPAGKLAQLLWFSCRSLVGFATYMIAAIALKMPEPQEVLAKIAKRLQRFPKQS